LLYSIIRYPKQLCL